MKIFYLFIKTCFFLFLFGVTILLNAEENNKERLFLQKTDARLLAQLSINKPTEFLVLMNEQADVRGAYNLTTKEEKGEFVFKKLTEITSRTQSNILSFLKSKAVSYRQFWIVNGIAVTGNIDLAKELASFPEVKSLLENSKFIVEKPVANDYIAPRDATARGIEWQITKVKADQVWALGFKGQGAVVAGQDTGYEWDNLCLQEQYRGWNGAVGDHNYNWHDAVHTGGGGACGVNSIAPCDDNKHGTHTMGSMVGDDKAGNQVGMAPKAKWIGCRNMNVGVGTLNSYLECFQWLLAPTDLKDQNPMPSKAPHVVNNSWGCDGTEGCNTSNFAVHQKAVGNLRAAGVLVVVSAGNDGSGCSTVKTSSAIFDESFSVGSTTNTDAMSSFSSRGPVTIDGSNRRKPDISAPGSGVRSCVPGGSFASMSGTSMAGPQVVGLVALMISANPALAGQVDSIESIIERTAFRGVTNTQTCGGTSPTTWPNNTVGYGRIDALAAVKEAIKFTTSIKPIPLEVSVKVFPNPANDILTFLLSDLREEGTIKIYSVEGQMLAERPISSFETKVTISANGFAKGLYIYTLETPQQSYYGKFLKN